MATLGEWTAGVDFDRLVIKSEWVDGALVVPLSEVPDFLKLLQDVATGMVE